MSMRCTVCTHFQRVVIDRTIASGTESFRSLAKRYGLSAAAILRHSVNHLQVDPMATPAGVAKRVLAGIQHEREKEARNIASIWLKRLDRTYQDAASAYEQAMNDEDGLDAAAKFAMVRARLCDTGLRADGILAGGADAGVTVNVQQLVLLPSPARPDPERRTIDIDIDKTDHQT